MGGATVYALAPIDGGKKKKKKKKIHKGPKKPTHRHKNVPMRVLKFYKVEGDGEGTEYKVLHEHRVPAPGLRRGRVHGAAQRPPDVRQVLAHVRDAEEVSVPRLPALIPHHPS